MSINFTARHTKVTPDIEKYCQKRIKNLEKFLGRPIEADLILSVEKYRQKAEIKVKSKRMTLNVTEETHDMLSSLDVAFDHIEKRMKKERDKLRKRKRRKILGGEFPPPEEIEEQRKKVIRSEDYSPKPMSLEEAMIQLDLNKKEVFVFRRMDSEKWAVLYRRKDGHYGLVEPE